jgi:hypothetical protein
MRRRLHRWMAIAAMGFCSPVFAEGPSGGNYSIPLSIIASGVAGMAGGAYTISASLGDLSNPMIQSGGTYQFYAGFWTGGAVLVPQLCLLDVDGNSSVDALTDGLLILRAMFGLTGTSVTNGAIGQNATRTNWAQIQPAIRFPQLDIDDNGTTDALTDGLLILRAMFGLTGTAVTNGAVAGNAQRATWAAVRSYLNASCGANFAP